MTRVLVTGASGFVGRAVLAVMETKAWEVHAVSRRQAEAEDQRRAVWHQVDLLEPEAPKRLIERVRPTHLLHLAWETTPGEYWTSEANRRWVPASLELLREFAARGGRRAVIAGTSAEYDWNADVGSEEDTPLAPASLYGGCKLALYEAATQLAQRAGLSLAWGRLFSTFGPGDVSQRVIPSVTRALLAGRPAPCTNGSQIRDFLFVEDAAAAFTELLESGCEGAVNVASGTPVTVRDVASEVGQAIGRAELIRFGALPARPGDPPKLVPDTRKLREEVPFTPRVSLEDGIARTVAWWRTRS